MQHLDEGTIHAWLDGELPPAEREAAEAHVASCDECRAAVAEARGFIAASSRILTALDAVPGGVLPASTTSAFVKKRAPAKFTISRAWMAAAAVLVLSTPTVIAVRPRRETAALAAPASPVDESATNVAAPKADEIAEISKKLADKSSQHAEARRKDANVPARDSSSAPISVADAVRARDEEPSVLAAPKAAAPAASAAGASGSVAQRAAPMVAQAPATAPPHFGDTATSTAKSRPMALNSVVVTGAGTMTAVGKLDAAMASDSAAPTLLSRSAAPTLLSRSAAAIAGDTVVTSVYLVNGASVTLLDRSAGHSELRREAQVAPREQPMAKSRDVSAPRLNSLTWSDSTGRTRTLRGAVSQVELERIKAALFGATP